jgi:hypothetical protein
MTISYTGLVLTKESRTKLLSTLDIPEGWEVVLHHVTLNMGPFKGNRDLLGQTFKVRVDTKASDDKVMAVGVDLPAGVTSKNATPHITVAVNRGGGGKPVMSNNLKEWNAIPSMTVETVLEEVEMGNPDPKRVASRHLTAGSKGVVSDLESIERAYKAIFIEGLNSNSRIPNEAYIDEIQSRLDSIMDHCSEITHQSFRLEKAGKKFADNFDTTLSQDDLKIMRDAVNAITRVVNG